MKKLLFSLAVLTMLVASVANAGKWVQKEIKWQFSRVGSPRSGTEIYVRDTTYTVFGGAALDTSAVFSLDGVDFPPVGLLQSVDVSTGSGDPDSLAIAYIVVSQDSAATGTITAGAGVTCIIEGATGEVGTNVNLSAGWAKVDSIIVGNAGAVTTSQVNYGALKNVSEYGPIFPYNSLRLRTIADAHLLPSARIYLRYWDADKP